MAFTLSTLFFGGLVQLWLLMCLIGSSFFTPFTPTMIQYHRDAWVFFFVAGYVVIIPVAGFWAVLRETHELKVQVQRMQKDKTTQDTALADTQDMVNCCLSLNEQHVQELQSLNEEVQHIHALVRAALPPPQVVASPTSQQSRPQARRSGRRYPALQLM